MSAANIRVVSIVVPNPLYDASKTARVINPNIGYALRLSQTFQTLSSTNPQNFDPIEGLLYVPQLPTADAESDACAAARAAIPANATTLSDFPSDQDYPLVAIFPWTSIECTEAYLSQARADAVRGVFTYLQNVSSGSFSRDPPVPSDDLWSLNDGGYWRSANQYPVYALSSTIGPSLMQEMSLYSGSMAEAPNGGVLVDQYDERDFPRLFAHVDLRGGASVPSLWIFLIIVLAVLLGVVIIASIIMHIIQRHQRHNLRRRLERGEVDLESLGIKKMNVPQQKIDEMPKYVYTDGIQSPPAVAASRATPRSPTQPQTASFSQSTCAICLDDFVHNETEVRELPCKHIFHPECIDLFLRDSSSLCPMCKVSALPAGYFPIKVTNMMVRRERIVRRMRERRQHAIAAAMARAAAEESGSTPPPAPQPTSRFHFGRSQRRDPVLPTVAEAESLPVFTVPNRDHQLIETPGAVEMSQIQSAEATSPPARRSSQLFNARRQTIAIPPEVAAQGSAARRAWRRERLARQQEEQYNQQAETTREADVGRPLWRRVVGRIVPTFN